MPVSLVLRELRQEDDDFKASLEREREREKIKKQSEEFLLLGLKRWLRG